MKPIFEDKKSGIYVGVGDTFFFPEHMHALVEMIYAFSGETNVSLDGTEYCLLGGDLGLAFSNVSHGYNYGSGEHLMLIFPADISGDYGNILTNRPPENPVLRARELHMEVDRMAQAIRREYQLGSGDVLIKAYIQVILARIMPLFRAKPHLSGEKSELVYRIMQAVSARYSEDISMDDLAEELGVSKYHLSHVFSQKIGVNFREYVNALRVDRARMLLKATAAPVTEVCYECGFENQRTFNRAFQRVCGMTPTQFREE